MPMTYGEPIKSVADLKDLDGADVVEGYNDGLANEPEPKGNRSKSYWHGWRNGQIDGGHAKPDQSQRLLARDYLKNQRTAKTS